MLHQPTSGFEPSQPVPSTPARSTAQPFDIKRYLQRARELGTMVYPAISSNGRHLVGYSAYSGYSFGQSHRQLVEEFDEPATAVVFEGLCEDFELNPADESFNAKVNLICHARNRASLKGDKRLIELCKRARSRLAKDRESIDRVCDLTERLEALQPAKPTYSTSGSWTGVEPHSSAEMRAKLPAIRKCNPKSIVDEYRARIANVAAYEKECDRLRREIGLRRAEASHRGRWYQSQEVVLDIVDMPATTMKGLAHKAAVLFAWKSAGYELTDEGERLAFSIAEDARMLGTSAPYEKTSRSCRRQPSAQVHH